MWRGGRGEGSHIHKREEYVRGGEVVSGHGQLSAYFAVRSVIFDGKFRFGSVRYGRGGSITYGGRGVRTLIYIHVHKERRGLEVVPRL